MDQVISQAGKSNEALISQVQNEDPFVEFNKYFSTPPVLRALCPDPVAWWGVSFSIFMIHKLTLTNVIA